jgi:hypothetical protein
VRMLTASPRIRSLSHPSLRQQRGEMALELAFAFGKNCASLSEIAGNMIAAVRSPTSSARRVRRPSTYPPFDHRLRLRSRRKLLRVDFDSKDPFKSYACRTLSTTTVLSGCRPRARRRARLRAFLEPVSGNSRTSLPSPKTEIGKKRAETGAQNPRPKDRNARNF